MAARSLLVPLVLGALLPACDPAGTDADTRVPAPPKLSDAPVIGIANIDDDDENGSPDWEDAGAPDDNDTFTLDVSGAGDLALTLAGDTDAIRVWRDGAIVLDDTTREATVPGGTLAVEFGDMVVTGTLTVTPVDAAVAPVTVALSSAPLILNNHLQGAERVMAMEGGGNDAFVEGFSDVLGGSFFTGALRSYDWDVWVQDELEFATMTAPGARMDVVIDSVRSGNDRYLDNFPEAELEGPDTAVRTWGSGRATSQDSFGNLEVSPPVTVDGVDYPFGRVYWGETGSWGLTEDLGEMLEAQKVQAPFQVDIRWLCVGHVDEFSSFVPDPSAPKGFRLLYADTNVGRSFLAGLDPTTELPRYADGHNVDSIGDLVNDSALWSYNEDLQRDYLDPNLDIFKRELGLDDEDIIRIPAVFEESGYCGGAALSLIPGTVNLVVADIGDGETHVFLPDPFLREDDDDLASDPLIAEVGALLPSTLSLHWVDDWDWYHMAWGEVHCGSNTQRTPTNAWWETATHLMEAE